MLKWKQHKYVPREQPTCAGTWRQHHRNFLLCVTRTGQPVPKPGTVEGLGIGNGHGKAALTGRFCHWASPQSPGIGVNPGMGSSWCCRQWWLSVSAPGVCPVLGGASRVVQHLSRLPSASMVARGSWKNQAWPTARCLWLCHPSPDV